MSLATLRSYIAETRPELARELGPLLLYDAVTLLCRREGLTLPAETEETEMSCARLLVELRRKDSGSDSEGSEQRVDEVEQPVNDPQESADGGPLDGPAGE